MAAHSDSCSGAGGALEGRAGGAVSAAEHEGADAAAVKPNKISFKVGDHVTLGFLEE